jgi:aryl-alcohol dehydrogenase-like predicted oxidoreductase
MHMSPPDVKGDAIPRRDAIKVTLGLGAMFATDWRSVLSAETTAVRSAAALPLIERTIPSSGEKLPIVGIGTARSYENPTPQELAAIRDVLKQFPALGGKLLDTAPSYGNAESVVGSALEDMGLRDRYFLATKVGRPATDRASAIAQMEQSFKRLQSNRVDLMQLWNVFNPEIGAPLLDEWKAARRIRYTGITSSSKGQYAVLEAAMKKFKFDFVQIDLAINNRTAQDRIIPLAADRGTAVLVNLPFGRESVFARVQGRPLPDWAREIDATSWAQVFLKYITSNPSVTAVIPGTATVQFMVDNNLAARGRLPDAAMRKRIESYYDQIA